MSTRIKDFTALRAEWLRKTAELDVAGQRAWNELFTSIRELKAAGVDVSPKPERSSPQQREAEREAENQGVSIEDYLREQH